MTVVVLKGNDDTLLSQAVSDKVKELVGSGDASLMVEELGEEQYRMEDDTFAITRLVDAAQTRIIGTDVGDQLDLQRTIRLKKIRRCVNCAKYDDKGDEQIAPDRRCVWRPTGLPRHA